jgi:hypothetical protein
LISTLVLRRCIRMGANVKGNRRAAPMPAEAVHRPVRMSAGTGLALTILRPL